MINLFFSQNIVLKRPILSLKMTFVEKTAPANTVNFALDFKNNEFTTNGQNNFLQTSLEINNNNTYVLDSMTIICPKMANTTILVTSSGQDQFAVGNSDVSGKIVFYGLKNKNLNLYELFFNMQQGLSISSSNINYILYAELKSDLKTKTFTAKNCEWNSDLTIHVKKGDVVHFGDELYTTVAKGPIAGRVCHGTTFWDEKNSGVVTMTSQKADLTGLIIITDLVSVQYDSIDTSVPKIWKENKPI